MANPIILFALAAAVLSLAALSAAASTPNHHELAPSPQPTSKLHHAPPPSSPSKKKPHRHRRHHHHKRHPHHPVAQSRAVGRGAALPPEPYPGYAEPAEKCLKKLNKQCASEIFGGVFGVGKVENISDKCCMNLVAMGQSCHRGVQAAMLALPWLEKREKRLIKKKNAEVWSRCALVAGALKFAESPFSYPSVA